MKQTCPKCSKVLSIPAKLVGKAVKCPCGTIIKALAARNVPSRGGPPVPRPRPAPAMNSQPLVDDGLFDELTESDLSQFGSAPKDSLGASQGMTNIAVSEIQGAVGHLTEKRRDNSKEGRRLKFIYISLAIFVIAATPNAAFFLYKSSRNSTGFYAAWQKQNSEASLMTGSTGGTKVVGAEAQKPVKVTNFKHLYQPAGIKEYRDQLALRIQALLDEQMAKEIETYASRDQQFPENGFLDWLIGWPEKLEIEKLDVNVTNNDFILCQLVITGQPLKYALEADFYITNVTGYKWKKSTDNAPFGEPKNNLLRDTIIKNFVIKMQK